MNTIMKIRIRMKPSMYLIKANGCIFTAFLLPDIFGFGIINQPGTDTDSKVLLKADSIVIPVALAFVESMIL